MKYYLYLPLLLVCAEVQSQIRNPSNIAYHFSTDTTKRSVDLSELMMVLPRQSFPIIDYPKFVGKSEGLLSFFRHEPVISVEIGGKAKAYPLNMLTAHEIANDTLSGIPILPTYCPLCNASVVFDRRLKYNSKDYLLEFEVSGMLRNSDMVMFDRETETWWQQLMGEAIVGELNGAALTVIPSMVVSVETFFKTYPRGRILSKNTGHIAAMTRYGTNPYAKYDTKDQPYSRFFHQEKVHPDLPAMERVVDIYADGKYRIYPFSEIVSSGVINDTFKGKDIVIFYNTGMVSVLDEKDIATSRDVGAVTVFSPILNGVKYTFEKKGRFFIDDQTSSKWNISGRCVKGELKGSQLALEVYSNHFAFAWLAFHPDSEIYKGK